MRERRRRREREERARDAGAPAVHASAPFLCPPPPRPPHPFQAFVDHYYNTFDTNRPALGGLYTV